MSHFFVLNLRSNTVKSAGMSQIEADYINVQLDKMREALNQAEIEMKKDGGLLIEPMD